MLTESPDDIKCVGTLTASPDDKCRDADIFRQHAKIFLQRTQLKVFSYEFLILS
jgi:hypothetical protein